MQLILNFNAYIIEKQTNLKYVKKKAYSHAKNDKNQLHVQNSLQTVILHIPKFDKHHDTFWKKTTFTVSVCTEKNSTYPGIVEQSNFSRYRPKNLLD